MRVGGCVTMERDIVYVRESVGDRDTESVRESGREREDVCMRKREIVCV